MGVIETGGEFADLVYGEDGRVWLQYYLSAQGEAATDLLALEDVIAVRLRRLHDCPAGAGGRHRG